MRRFIMCLFVAMMSGANVFGAWADVSRVVSNKSLEKPDTERVVESNRSSRRANNANISENKSVVSRGGARSGGTTKSDDVVSRSSLKNSNIVSRGAKKNISRAASEVNTIVNTRNTRIDDSEYTSTSRRSPSVLGRPMGDDITEQRTRQSVIDDSEADSVTQDRALTSLFRKQSAPTAESIAAAKDLLEKTADLNNVCQQQYNECMDQFCAVIDANQKRCSCSDNLNKYAKVQKAVEDANAELNDVAQNIRYLGLSADEIRAIMNATDAELELSKTKDTSQTRSMLDDIADMIKDPTSGTASYWSGGTDSLFDMDLDFSSNSSSLFSLDLFTSKTNDISSKRGKDLYNEATKRCKTVLNKCKEAGATESQVSGNYDLEISKDCIAYEQGLEKLNQTLLSNIRSANLMLQKGRLAVLQNKNLYDARGCIGALENCMLDEMVCGEDYLKCLDPTKNYIDENGNVVLGRNITNITGLMEPDGNPTEGYSNTKITAAFIENAVKTGDTTCVKSDGACIVNYLMSKIGTGQSVKDGGLCRAVLDKCQDYTYDSDGKTSTYKPYNDVVVNYIQRAMVNIHAAQARIISDYASSCMSDISECYNQQISQINAFTTTASANSVYGIMTGACYNVALTCGYAVFAYDAAVGAQIAAAESESAKRTVLIQAVSDLFYQSLLCPSNSSFAQNATTAADTNRTKEGYVNLRCKCNDGYTVWGGACVPSCSDTKYRTDLGACDMCSGTDIPVSSNPGVQENSYCANPSAVDCPAYSVSQNTLHDISPNRTIAGYVTNHCKCENSSVWNGTCVTTCLSEEFRDNTGQCSTCQNGYTPNYAGINPNTTEASSCVLDTTINCPENSDIQDNSHTVDDDRTIAGYVSNYCKCKEGYTVWNGGCISTCDDLYHQYRHSSGRCLVCDDGFAPDYTGGETEASGCKPKE